MPSIGHARIVMGITMPMFLISTTVISAIGLIMVAYFYDCDPLKTREIYTKDQLVILFSAKVLGQQKEYR